MTDSQDASEHDTIGAAFVSIIPTFAGGIKKISAEIDAALAGTGRGSRQAGEEAGRSYADGFKFAEHSVESLGSKIKETSKVALGMAGLFGGFKLAESAGEALKGAMSLQREMQVIQNASNDLTFSTTQMGQKVTAVSNATGASLDQVSKGLYTTEAAGFKGAAAYQVLMAGMKGAADEGADSQVVLGGLTTIMKDYGIKASDASEAMNMMLVSSGNTKASLQEYSGALANVLPTASALGLKLPEVAAAISVMTQKGFTAQRATMDLNHGIMSLTNATSVQGKEMALFGLGADQVRESLGKNGLAATLQMMSDTVQRKLGPSLAHSKQLMGEMSPAALAMAKQFSAGTLTVGQMENKMGKLPAAQQKLLEAFMPGAQGYVQAMAKMTGGNTSLMSALALTGSAGQTAMSQLTKANDEALHSTSDLNEKFAKTSQTASMHFQMLENKAKNMGVSLATAALPTLMKISDEVGVLMDKAEALVSKEAKIFGPYAKEIDAYAKKFYAANKSWLVPLAKDLITAYAAAKVFSKSTDLIKGVIRGFTTGSPLGGLLTGLDLAVIGFKLAYDHSKTFRDFVNGAVRGLKTEFLKLWREGIEPTFSKLSSTAQNVARIFEQRVWPLISSGLGTVKRDVGGFVTFVETHFGQIARVVTAPFASGWHIVSTLFGGAKSLISGFVHWVEKTFFGVSDGVSKPFKKGHGAISTIMGDIRLVVGGLASWITKSFVPTLIHAWGEVEPGLKSLAKFFTSSFGIISAITHAVLKVIGPYFSGVVKANIDVVIGVFKGFVGFLNAGVFPIIQALFKDIVVPVFKAIGTVITTTIRVVSDTIGLFLDLLTGHWSKAWGSLKDLVKSALGGVLSIAKDLVGGLGSFMFDAGKDVINGLVKGITSMKDAPGKILKDIGGGLVGSLKGVLGIFSPSRVMADEVGQWIPKGVAKGIDEHSAEVTKASTKLGAKAVSGTKSGAKGAGINLNKLTGTDASDQFEGDEVAGGWRSATLGSLYRLSTTDSKGYAVDYIRKSASKFVEQIAQVSKSGSVVEKSIALSTAQSRELEKKWLATWTKGTTLSKLQSEFEARKREGVAEQAKSLAPAKHSAKTHHATHAKPKPKQHKSHLTLNQADIKILAQALSKAVESGAEQGTSIGIQKRSAVDARQASHRRVVGR